MENVLKPMEIAFGVIITCIVISMAVVLAQNGQSTAVEVSKVFNQVTSEIDSDRMRMYTEDEIYGSDVLNFIRQYRNDIRITVFKRRNYTAGTGNVLYNGGDFLTAGNTTCVNYYAACFWDIPYPGWPDYTSEDDTLSNSYGNLHFGIVKVPTSSAIDNVPQNETVDNTYINPSCKYRGKVLRNDNNVITDMYFVQVSSFVQSSSPI